MNGLCAMKSLLQHPAGCKKQTSSNYSSAGKVNTCFSCFSDQDGSVILATCETMGYPFNHTWKYVMFINSVIFSVLVKLLSLLPLVAFLVESWKKNNSVMLTRIIW